MKIGIQTWGSEGDINPFIALASALSEAGHTVTLAITGADRKDYKKIAEQQGFQLGAVDYIGSSEDELNAIGKKMIETANPLKQLRMIFRDMFEPGADAMYATAQSLVADNDILIGHFIHYPLQTACEKAGKPYITVALNAGAIPTRYAPPIPFPNLGKFFNGLAWKLTEKMISNAVLPHINAFRKKQGLKVVKSFRTIWESPLCNLIAVSPLFCPPAKDWTANHKICGFLKLDDDANKWQMPDNLEQFLSNGEPPVYMTLGSMTGTEHNSLMISETTRLLYDAAKLAGGRAIIQSRWEHVSGIPEDENIFRVNASPYMKVFPKCKAVVHHGGAGTTQTATLCGCASVVIAHIQDQFLYGWYLKKLGIGGKVLSRHTVTPQKIAKEIGFITERPQMSEKAKRAGEMLAAENGLQNAVKIIEKTFNS
jgi:sterol 3beta-glucosyltransferase